METFVPVLPGLRVQYIQNEGKNGVALTEAGEMAQNNPLTKLLSLKGWSWGTSAGPDVLLGLPGSEVLHFCHEHFQLSFWRVRTLNSHSSEMSFLHLLIVPWPHKNVSTFTSCLVRLHCWSRMNTLSCMLVSKGHQADLGSNPASATLLFGDNLGYSWLICKWKWWSLAQRFHVGRDILVQVGAFRAPESMWPLSSLERWGQTCRSPSTLGLVLQRCQARQRTSRWCTGDSSGWRTAPCTSTSPWAAPGSWPGPPPPPSRSPQRL